MSEPGAALSLRSLSEEETERFGASLAPLLRPGDVVALVGPLGAGKTRFVAGLARGIDARARVRSPTFTLVNEYHGAVTLLHVDLYRLERGDVAGLGLEEALESAVVVVEWGEKLPSSFAATAMTIHFELGGVSERRIEVTARDGRGVELLSVWREALGRRPAESR